MWISQYNVDFVEDFGRICRNASTPTIKVHDNNYLRIFYLYFVTVKVLFNKWVELSWQKTLVWWVLYLTSSIRNNKSSEQQMHPCSLISTFVFCCLDNVVYCTLHKAKLQWLVWDKRPFRMTWLLWASSWENLFMLYANNKGADQPAHPCSLISTFVVRCLDS